MNGDRLFNFIAYPIGTIVAWLIAFGLIPGIQTVAIVIGIGMPLIFCWIYVPIFRKRGWATFTEIFGDNPE